MDGTLDEWVHKSDTVDTEVRAYVSSLVTAVSQAPSRHPHPLLTSSQLGGISVEQHGRYVLGDSALECLKDIRRWLRVYDSKLDRLDVQRVLAESNLVKGDLLEILAGWQGDALFENKLRYKIATGCCAFSLCCGIKRMLTLVQWSYLFC